MGQFSWITQDTNESIRNNANYNNKAFLHDDKGNVWKELDYEGYGEFGGKDFYELVAEMNNLIPSNPNEELRELGINLSFSNKPYKSPNLTANRLWTWIDKAPKICPNQGWKDLDDNDD